MLHEGATAGPRRCESIARHEHDLNFPPGGAARHVVILALHKNVEGPRRIILLRGVRKLKEAKVFAVNVLLRGARAGQRPGSVPAAPQPEALAGRSTEQTLTRPDQVCAGFNRN